MRTATPYVVRRMRIDDISQVLEVERESFPSMWPPTAFKRELQQNRLAHYTVVVERNPEYTPGAAAEMQPEHRGLSKIWDELRQFLGVEEPGGGALAPPDLRPELIVGFIGVWMLPDEAHIVTIAVRESHRRAGIGELLVISAIEMAREHSQSLVTLECRVTNEPALALYEKYGFQQVGLRPRYYSDNQEDAYVLTVSSVLADSYRLDFERNKDEHRRRWGDFDFDGG